MPSEVRGARHFPRWNANLFVGLAAAFALGVGGVLYLGFRTPHLRVFRWLESLGFGQPAQSLRKGLGEMFGTPPNWIRYSLGDGLWLLSLLLALQLVWKGYPGVTKTCQIAAITAAVVHESSQAMWPGHGTFSWGDIAAYVLAGALQAGLSSINKD